MLLCFGEYNLKWNLKWNILQYNYERYVIRGKLVDCLKRFLLDGFKLREFVKCSFNF